MVQETLLIKEFDEIEGKSKEELALKTAATTKPIIIMTNFRLLKNMVENFKK